MNHPYSRPETALERVSTIIQGALTGHATAHEAAERVFAALGLSVAAPLPPLPPTNDRAEQGKRAACTPPSPLPPPVAPLESDEEEWGRALAATPYFDPPLSELEEERWEHHYFTKLALGFDADGAGHYADAVVENMRRRGIR